VHTARISQCQLRRRCDKQAGNYQDKRDEHPPTFAGRAFRLHGLKAFILEVFHFLHFLFEIGN
jgi:hypothetical protein